MHAAVDYSCGVCRMWDSVSRKKLRNPPVYAPSHLPHCTISGLFPENELHAQQPLQEVERFLRGVSGRGSLERMREFSMTSPCSYDRLDGGVGGWGVFTVTFTASPEATRHFAVSWVRRVGIPR